MLLSDETKTKSSPTVTVSIAGIEVKTLRFLSALFNTADSLISEEIATLKNKEGDEITVKSNADRNPKQ